MKLDELVVKLLNEYPHLYGHRNQVLHDLYCVMPNNFRWENGKLVPKILPKRSSIDERVSQYCCNLSKKDLIEEEYRLIEELKNGEIFVFPIYLESNLGRVPDDVDEDYLEGAYEIIEIIKSLDTDYHDTHTRESNSVVRIKNYDQNIESLNEIKENLDKRFK